METWVALLRGVNVGGRNKLPMKALAAELESIGLTGVRTYIQSGNILLCSPRADGASLAAEIGAAIKSRFGFEPGVTVMSVEALAEAETANPFPVSADGADGKSVHFYFLSREPCSVDGERLDRARRDSERWQIKGAVLYLHAPDGVADSKLAGGVERILGVGATARNARTVRALLDLAGRPLGVIRQQATSRRALLTIRSGRTGMDRGAAHASRHVPFLEQCTGVGYLTLNSFAYRIAYADVLNRLDRRFRIRQKTHPSSTPRATWSLSWPSDHGKPAFPGGVPDGPRTRACPGWDSAMIFIIDFDGLLSPESSADELSGCLADPLWREIGEEWLAGRISMAECLRGQAGLFRGDRVTFGRFFRGIQLDPSFRAFLRHVRGFAQVAVLGDGPDYAIHNMFRGHALNGGSAHANRPGFVPPDSLDLTFLHRQADCRGGKSFCKCAVAKQLAIDYGGPVVLISDGTSDACLASVADTVFARHSSTGQCNIHHIRFEDFSDVLEAVRAWSLSTDKDAVSET